MIIHMSPAAATREGILESATHLFAERGFYGVAVPKIAEEAGVAAGTIYRHFASKDELVNVLYREWKTKLIGHLLDDFPFATRPREQLGALWHRLATFARAHPDGFAFLELHHHAPYLDAGSLALERMALQPVVTLVQQAAATGVLRSGPPEVLIAMIWGAFVGLVKAARQGYFELTDEVLAHAEACCWDALTPPPPEAP